MKAKDYQEDKAKKDWRLELWSKVEADQALVDLKIESK